MRYIHLIWLLQITICLGFYSTLSGQRFTNIYDIKNYIDNFIVSKPKSFFEQGIRKLSNLWTKVIESQGKYFND